MKKSHIAIIVIFMVLVIDQALKIWVKTSFCYGEERALFGLSWARLNFVENPGMAFGWKFGGDYGKLALSLFRIVAIGFLTYYVYSLIQKKVGTGLIVSFSLILAGAIGNIIDSAFYGMIFSASDFHCVTGPAKLFPPEGGYESFLHGKVVDMLYFPLWRNSVGEVVFFEPVFNIADSAITTGVISILLFQRQYFSGHDEKPPVQETVTATIEDNIEAETEKATETETETETEPQAETNVNDANEANVGSETERPTREDVTEK